MEARLLRRLAGVPLLLPLLCSDTIRAGGGGGRAAGESLETLKECGLRDSADTHTHTPVHGSLPADKLMDLLGVVCSHRLSPPSVRVFFFFLASNADLFQILSTNRDVLHLQPSHASFLCLMEFSSHDHFQL